MFSCGGHVYKDLGAWVGSFMERVCGLRCMAMLARCVLCQSNSPHGGFYDAYQPAASSGTQKHQIKSCYSGNMLIVRYGFMKLSKKTHKHALPVASIPSIPESTLTSRRGGPDKNLGECALLSWNFPELLTLQQ